MTAPWEDTRAAANGRAVKDNFDAWFAGSRAVDAKGCPSVFYHGTNYAFDRFSTDRLGASVDNPTTQFGFFFTDDPQDAASWAERAVLYRRCEPAAQVMPVYLRIERPKKMDYELFHYYLQTARADTIRRHLEKWRAAGFDGLEVESSKRHRWMCAFEPGQIKSALGNSGLFQKHSASLADEIDSLHLKRALDAKCAVAQELYKTPTKYLVPL